MITKSKLMFALFFFLLTSSAGAYVDRSLMLEGTLQSFNQTTAKIKTSKSVVLVPVQTVKRMHYRTGQAVVVFVDAGDFVRLNKKAIESAAHSAQ